MGVWVFGDLAGFGIEAADDIHFIGRIPDVVIAIDTQRIGRCSGSGQVEFFESLRLRIEPPDLPSLIFGISDDTFVVNFDAPRPAALGGWRPSRNLSRVRIDHSDFALWVKFR